jgi:cyclopropane fatty-acyl-phospholipid synthase-like methyltransferase
MEEKDWFDQWFDSKYYHLLYNNRDYTEAERFISNLIQYLRIEKGSKVLDLACGRGRHSRFLHTKGMEVLGVDLSQNSIDFAKKESKPGLEFAVHDMREPLNRGEFDYVLNLFTSFGYFDSEGDDLKTLSAIKGEIGREGVFVQDFFNAQKVVANLVPEQVIDRGEVQFKITRTFDGSFITKTIDFEDQDRKAHSYFERVRAYGLEDFKSLYEKSGLRIMETYGDYDLNPYDPDTSDRLILVARIIE